MRNVWWHIGTKIGFHERTVSVAHAHTCNYKDMHSFMHSLTEWVDRALGRAVQFILISWGAAQIYILLSNPPQHIPETNTQCCCHPDKWVSVCSFCSNTHTHTRQRYLRWWRHVGIPLKNESARTETSRKTLPLKKQQKTEKCLAMAETHTNKQQLCLWCQVHAGPSGSTWKLPSKVSLCGCKKSLHLMAVGKLVVMHTTELNLGLFLTATVLFSFESFQYCISAAELL